MCCPKTYTIAAQRIISEAMPSPDRTMTATVRTVEAFAATFEETRLVGGTSSQFVAEIADTKPLLPRSSIGEECWMFYIRTPASPGLHHQPDHITFVTLCGDCSNLIMNKDLVSPKPYPVSSIAGRGHRDPTLEIIMSRTAY